MGRSLSQLPNRLSTFNAADRFYVVRGTSNYYTTYADLSSAFGGGGGGVPTEITVADEAADTTCFPAFFTAATGDLGPKTNVGLTFDASTGFLRAAGFTLPVSGGDIVQETGGTPSTLLRLTVDPISSDEFVELITGLAGTGPAIQAGGAASDININIAAKGTGGIYITPQTGGGIFLNNSPVSLSAAFTTTGTSGITLAAPSTGSPITYTLPTTAATLARTDAAQTFTGTQTFGAITSTADQTFSDTGEGVIFHGSGKISGASGAVTIAASGTNQNATVAPSGTGLMRFRTDGQAGFNARNSTDFDIVTTTGRLVTYNGTTVNYEGTARLGFGSGGLTAIDTAISRSSAGVIAVGTGAAANASGSLLLTNLTASGVVYLGTYTVGTLPTATVRGFIYVSNESGGAVPAFADGTNWRRVTDRAIVS